MTHPRRVSSPGLSGRPSNPVSRGTSTAVDTGGPAGAGHDTQRYVAIRPSRPVRSLTIASRVVRRPSSGCRLILDTLWQGVTILPWRRHPATHRAAAADRYGGWEGRRRPRPPHRDETTSKGPPR